jgi:hypothetical protein
VSERVISIPVFREMTLISTELTGPGTKQRGRGSIRVFSDGRVDVRFTVKTGTPRAIEGVRS